MSMQLIRAAKIAGNDYGQSQKITTYKRGRDKTLEDYRPSTVLTMYSGCSTDVLTLSDR